MSSPTMPRSSRNRWMDWQPRVQVSTDHAGSGPTKPSKPNSVGFDGATSHECPKIEQPPNSELDPSTPGSVGFEGTTSSESLKMETEPSSLELMRASAVLRRAEVCIMELEDGLAIGVWSDLDGPEIRDALRISGSDSLVVRYLDGGGIPMSYKLRGVQGEPVPLSVLAEMERNQAEPWEVRDRLLKDIGWSVKNKASAGRNTGLLNQLFFGSRRDQRQAASPQQLPGSRTKGWDQWSRS